MTAAEARELCAERYRFYASIDLPGEPKRTYRCELLPGDILRARSVSESSRHVYHDICLWVEPVMLRRMKVEE